MLKSIRPAALAVLVFLVAGGCDTGTEPSGHRLPRGMQIGGAGGTVLVTIDAQRNVTGSLTVRRGEELTLEVYFVDEAGDRHRASEGGDYPLGWEIVNGAIAAIEAHGDHYDLVGRAGGTTAVRFKLMHGGHSDYDSPLVPIVVTP